MICDELELVHQLDRVWYSSSDPESLRKRSNVLEHLGNAVGFPPHLLGILTRGAEEMAQMMEVYQVQLRQHVTWWRESSPLIFSWQLPSHFVKVLTAQSKDPKAFCSQHERYAQES